MGFRPEYLPMSYEVNPTSPILSSSSSSSEDFVRNDRIKTVKNYITFDFGKRLTVNLLLITLGREEN
jgi:hypothetical protein